MRQCMECIEGKLLRQEAKRRKPRILTRDGE